MAQRFNGMQRGLSRAWFGSAYKAVDRLYESQGLAVEAP